MNAGVVENQNALSYGKCKVFKKNYELLIPMSYLPTTKLIGVGGG